MTVLEIIRRTSDFFRTKDIDSPRLTIELMLCEVLGCSRIKLYMHYDKPLQVSELELLRSMVRRRGKREPLQYILGGAEFYGLPFKVSPCVLIPRPETELLVERAEKEITRRGASGSSHLLNGLQPSQDGAFRSSAEPQEKYAGNSSDAGLRILDIGTGSGCIAIALAKRFPQAIITAVDISAQALAVAQENARLHQINNITFVEADILSDVSWEQQFDVIVSNPPYISGMDSKGLQPEVGLFEPLSALTDNADGLTFYRRFAAIFPKLLTETGCFFVEIGYGQAEGAAEYFSASGFSVEVHKDYADIPRVLTGNHAIARGM